MEIDKQKAYFSYIFTLSILVSTGWILGNNNEKVIKYWYCVIMSLLLIIRIPDFRNKKYHHFFSEMCYFVNLLTIYFLLFNFDIKPIYPYLHGPLLFYAIFSGDAFVPNDLTKTTSFALHSFGTIISRHIYWNGNNTYNLDDFNMYSYFYYIKTCMSIYLMWFIPYSFYVLWYKGKSLTMIKYTLKLKLDEEVKLFTKISYLIKHLIITLIIINMGIVSLYCYELNIFICALQLISGIIQGSHFSITGKKLKFINVINTFLLKKNN
jgi:hypothetical protein